MTDRDELRRLGIPDDLVVTVNGKPLGEKPDVIVTWGNPIRIIVPGPTPGKPRMTQRDKWAKRAPVLRYRSWCDRVRAALDGRVIDENLVAELNWTAYFEPPSSWSKRRRVAAMGTRHRSKPDVDNVCKAILDCLWSDDSGIADVVARKRWDWKARLEIEIIIGD